MYPINSYYGNYRTRTFANIFPDATTFSTWYAECGVPQVLMTGAEYNNYDINAIYFLLLSEHANDHIMSSDENRFKLKVMSIIYEAGPVWQREMLMQKKFMDLTEQEIMTGSKAIYNHAQNPDSEPSTSSLTELTFISDQNTTSYTKARIDALREAGAGLDSEICQRFLRKFDKLFLTVVYPDAPLLYESED